MTLKFNPLMRRVEVTLLILVSISAVSFAGYAVTTNELFMWRSIALGFSVSLLLFLLYPTARGIKRGDVVMVSVWREIETPTITESYIDDLPTIALENGRKNSRIHVQLWDGSKGIVEIESYGFITPAEGKLLETEMPVRNRYLNP